MIKHSLKEAFRLTLRSKTECLAYLFALALSEVLMFALCRRFGVDYPLRSSGPEAGRLIYLVLFSAPALFITAWFGAGLVGRISMDAFKGSSGSMISYANGWFVRNLVGTVIISAAAFLPVVFVSVLPKNFAAVVMLAWFLFFIWLAIRVSLWPNIMFIEGRGPVAAMQRSYRVSGGYVIPLALLSLPLFARILWELGPQHLAAENIVVVNILKNLLIGLATLIQIGALATAYLTLKQGAPASAPRTTQAAS